MVIIQPSAARTTTPLAPSPSSKLLGYYHSSALRTDKSIFWAKPYAVKSGHHLNLRCLENPKAAGARNCLQLSGPRHSRRRERVVQKTNARPRSGQDDYRATPAEHQAQTTRQTDPAETRAPRRGP